MPKIVGEIRVIRGLICICQNEFNPKLQKSSIFAGNYQDAK
jgi:hypothetical protein